jgi:hypothetical protein
VIVIQQQQSQKCDRSSSRKLYVSLSTLICRANGDQDHLHLEYWTWPGRPAGYLVDLHFGDSLPRGFAQRSAKLLSEHL